MLVNKILMNYKMCNISQCINKLEKLQIDLEKHDKTETNSKNGNE